MSIMALASSLTTALDRALRMLEKVDEVEKAIECLIESPPLEKQQYENGYYRTIVVEDREVEFKRRSNSFVITNVRRVTQDGFYVVDEPYPIPVKQGTWTFIKDLRDGSQLYEWDDLGFLSGSAGEAIVRDGQVVMIKMTRRA